MDEINARILQELRDNARVPISALSDRVHLSRNAVKQRIERLEREGHISGYTIIERRKGLKSPIAAYLLIYRGDRLRGAEVIAFLSQIPEVVFCDVLTGAFDLLVRVEVDQAERVQEIWEQIAAHPGVVDTTTALALATPIQRLGPVRGTERT